MAKNTQFAFSVQTADMLRELAEHRGVIMTQLIDQLARRAFEEEIGRPALEALRIDRRERDGEPVVMLSGQDLRPRAFNRAQLKELVEALEVFGRRFRCTMRKGGRDLERSAVSVRKPNSKSVVLTWDERSECVTSWQAMNLAQRLRRELAGMTTGAQIAAE